MVKLQAGEFMQAKTTGKQATTTIESLVDKARQYRQWLLRGKSLEPDLDQVSRFRSGLLRDMQDGRLEKEKISQPLWHDLMDEQNPSLIWRYILDSAAGEQAKLESMRHALKYRKELGVDELDAEQCLAKEFWLKTPLGFTGKAADGSDVVYVVAKNYRKADGTESKQLIKKFVMHSIFSWDEQHKRDPARQISLVFDITDTTFRNMDLEFDYWLISLYPLMPLRISGSYVVGVPFLLRPIIRLIISWLPEHFRRCVHCIAWHELFEGDEPLLGLDQVPIEAGGSAEDTWRLAPSDIPWASQAADRFPSELLAKLDAAISFNTSQERLKQLYEMQEAHDQKTSEQSTTKLRIEST